MSLPTVVANPEPDHGDLVRRTLLTSLLAIALVLAGCGTDEEPAQSPSPTPSPTETVSPDTTEEETSPVDQSPTTPTETGTTDADDGAVAAMTFTDCSGEHYTVGYPEDWNTNDPEGQLDACEIFHPGEIDVPDQPRDRDLHYAASLYVDAVEYDRVRDSEPQGEVLEEQELTVDGQDAFVREVRSDGSGLVPESETSYTYIVDLDGEILVAATYSVGDTDYERDKAVLDRMITEELTIDDG